MLTIFIQVVAPFQLCHFYDAVVAPFQLCQFYDAVVAKLDTKE